MTAPDTSDARLLALAERLEDESRDLQKVAWGRQDGGQDCCINAILADEAPAALRAIVAERGDVRVKPLVWEDMTNQGYWRGIARPWPPVGYYIGFDRDAKSFTWNGSQHPTLEAAKAAAQADYDARIRAAARTYMEADNDRT